MLQQLLASDFAKNRKNVKRELCLKVIIPFCILFVILSLHDVPKKMF